MSDQGGVFKALLTGTALGVAIGILFAPRSGEETREQLKELSEKTRDSVDEGSKNLAERVRSLRGEVQTLTSQAVESGQKRVEDELEALSVAFQEGREILREEREKRSRNEEEEA